MKTYTVNQLAQLAGISVRALHHYDEIGLLKPAFTGDNRYRYYGDEELLRLQQILIHRELDIPLGEIGALLDAPGFDRLKTLQQQRERLAEQAERFAGMVRTIDRTIARLQGDREMKDADLYSGVVSPKKQAEYHAWLEQRFGEGARESIAAEKKRLAGLARHDSEAEMAELREIEQGLAEAMRLGVPPQAAQLEPLIERHAQWVGGRWGRTVTPEAYLGLTEIYLGHPDFVARYEQIEAGFTDYLASAMRSWAQRQD
ncbi:MAG: MerR family transcriptional regulator [Devosia sp.]|uniref:MerR family transcriptional regulator n=1 Tax=Devosia sp. TaxID=1871048 RepID=UPI0026226EB4|nr:MerR family transcriptional regulator [Devosia sp.]MDB5528539.1 MerR family transcriptional regulator [Devosia sp.]